MKTSNTGEVVGPRIFGGKIAPVGGSGLPYPFQKRWGANLYSYQLVNFLEKKKREEFPEFRILGTLYSIPHGLQNSFVTDKTFGQIVPIVRNK
jgi:hypothetical protein